MTKLATLVCAIQTVTGDINNSTQVVGWTCFSGGTGVYYACTWVNNGVTNLGLNRVANGVNDLGHIVGSSHEVEYPVYRYKERMSRMSLKID